MDLTKVDWTKMINVESLDIDDREPLRLEQEAFVQAVLEGSRPQVAAEDAIAAAFLKPSCSSYLRCRISPPFAISLVARLRTNFSPT